MLFRTALLAAELLASQTFRHTVGVIEASDVRRDEGRMHARPRIEA